MGYSSRVRVSENETKYRENTSYGNRRALEHTQLNVSTVEERLREREREDVWDSVS